LLEGLEIEIINKYVLQIDNDIFRIDSEFLLKKYIESILKIKEKKYLQFENLIELLTDGKHGGVDLKDEGVIFLRTTNIKKNKIDLSDLRYISNEESNQTLRAEFIENDLLLTTIGTIGLCVKVPKDFPRATINQNLVRIVLKDKEYSSVICCFLNSKYGRNQTLRYGAGNVYQMINYPNLKKIIIPDFSLIFSQEIDSIYLLSESKDTLSSQTYTQAETILLQEIGLQNFEPSKEPVNIKSFKESFGSTKRLDAEYYQKKYEQLIEKIVTQKHNSLINLVNISKSLEPGSEHYTDEGGLPFYRVADYNKFGLSQPNKELTNSFVANNKEQIEKLKPKQGTILFSKDGSVGTAYLLREDLQGITSSAILHLQIKNTNELLPEYLTLALNSKLVQMQAERDAGGSIILHWRKEEIEQVVVPIIEFKKQEQIAELVEESFKLKVESERLLEVAKKAVEMAIEEGEEKAMVFIEENI
jgi:type I restriction enzyme, S subunit